MTTIRAYRERHFYHSKYGEKLYIDSDDSNIAFEAAIVSGKGLKKEEELVYVAAGEDREEAQKSLDNYLKSINFCYTISRTEITHEDDEN